MDTTWMIITAAVALVITACAGIWLVPYLRKLKYGQTILDIGPKWHKSKQGTPTMGGIMFIVGIPTAVVVGFLMVQSQYNLQASPDYKQILARLFCGLVMALLYGLIGFMDDYIKIVKKQNLGLTASQKLFLQLVVGAIYLLMLNIFGGLSTILDIPFLGQLNIGLWFYPLAMLIIVGTVNAVNLTDGVDGLAASVTFVAAVGFMIISAMLERFTMSVMATALAAGCVGFLIWNFHPAKVFMGDTGSLFLGGMVVALGFGTGLPVYLLLIGVVYVVEALSVMIQVAYFKATHGKRLFKMTPIHHHFEMSNYSEVQIVALFSFISALGGILAIFAVKML